MARFPYRPLLGDRTLVPVVLGGDIGGYSIARAFYEAFGVRSLLMSATLNGIVRDSAMIENVVVPEMDDPDVMVREMLRLAEERPGADLIAVASVDWLVRSLIERKADLAHAYAIPYVDVELLDTVTSKDSFSDLCREHGLAHPRSVVVDLAKGPEVDTGDLEFPVIAKADDSAAYHAIEFEGKEKVFTVPSPEALTALLTRIHEAGYRDEFVVQDLIPGDDAGLRILNTYVGLDGKAAFTVYGHVLLQEHLPGTVGNSSVVLTIEEPEEVAKVERLLEAIGWRGFASLDMKVDPRTGETVYFELNPRLSRSNFFVTGAGINPAVAYVREHVLGLPAIDDAYPPQQRQTLFTILPRPLVMRYLIDKDTRTLARRLYRRRRVSHALWSRAERAPRRIAYLAAHQLNHVRKYRRWYPRTAQAAERASIAGMPHEGRAVRGAD
ncbi:ATP-grasp domain-containing protein [Demequina mangrovi]|uniref:D-aspartate ligase n=1 Tax=Demequina mangrovi TaxID=1043493 RepID=A0A1H6ZYE6_9MICO|nr:ATP-grasp domain-containing protein [Demequina mangrovi]SEJ58238.1 D-aspartate ligase [Demequina mangrovi]